MFLSLPRCSSGAIIFRRVRPQQIAPAARCHSTSSSPSVTLSDRQVARTLRPAFWRALDLEREDVMPLCGDRFASSLVDRLLPEAEREALERLSKEDVVEADIAGFHGAFLDRMMLDAVGRRLRQVVLIGAGMDTRAMRLDVPPQLKMVEVDEMAVQTAKKEVLQSVGASARCSLRSVEATEDFELQGVLPVLQLSKIIDARKPTMFLVDGYLAAGWAEEGCASSTFASLASLAGSGSRIVVQVRPTSATEAPSVATEYGEYACDSSVTVRDALLEAGWQRTDIVGAKALGRVFMRPTPPDGAGVLVVAEVGEASRPGRAPAERPKTAGGTGGPREAII